MRLILLALLLLLPGTASAGQARALVMDLIGTTEPEVFAFDEVDAGAKLTLKDGAELSLTFYPTCEDVTIRGGIVTIMDDHMTVDDNGEVLSYTKSDCPGDVTLAPSDIINAAIITRSANSKPKIGLRPTIGILGDDAAKYTEMRVHDATGLVQPLVVLRRKGNWPADAEPLEAGREYLVVLSGEDVQMRMAKVIASEDAPRVMVLRQ